MSAEGRDRLPPAKAAQYLLDECRMVLPGIQALFGFQLVAVFSPNFKQTLSAAEQYTHFLAIALATIAAAIIMTPAAFHRQRGSEEVTKGFVRLSSRLLLASMFPLAVSICLDFYLVGRVIAGGWRLPLLAAVLLFVVFAGLWVVLPRIPGLALNDDD